MAGGLYDSSLTRVQPFITALINREPTGADWLSALLAAAPNGQQLLDRLEGDPGTLLPAGNSIAPTGRLGCFEYPVAAPRELLAWFVEHPDCLEWPSKQTYSPETTKQRRALLYDEPPGRPAAQAAARNALESGASPNRK